MTDLVTFMSGGVTVLYGIAVIFFLRFWRRAGDALFLSFAAAFFLLACNQAAVGIMGPDKEAQVVFYTLRLAGFLIIAIAILAKNISRQ